MKMSAMQAGLLAALLIVTLAMINNATGQEPPPDPATEIGNLRNVDVNDHLPNLNGIVVNMEAAKKLGKALFWDMQAGSDGQACASCHFRAGADPRVNNQLHPGHLNELRDIQGDGTPGDDEFGGLVAAPGADADNLSPAGTAGFTAGGQIARANITLTANDFPLHQLQDMDERNSDIIITTNDVVSSAGAFGGSFNDIVFGSPTDDCSPAVQFSNIFVTTGGLPTRRVEPRHTPTVVNAIFMFDNFWDGRAKHIFNGVDPFGRRTIQAGKAKLLKLQGWSLAPVDLRNANGDLIKKASAASQAVGPPLSNHEMSCDGRTFPHIGKKLLRNGLRPLQQQEVHPDDHLLGPHRNWDGMGLNKGYSQMIREAFHYSWWAGFGTWDFDNMNAPTYNPSGFTQMEHNFSMFWGISVMLYESTLISDETPFFDFIEGDASALNASEERGLDIFLNQGKCVNCHATEIFTKASTLHLLDEDEEEGLVEFMPMAEGSVVPAFYDNGFYNIGIKPTVMDILRGGKGPFNNPLSFTRQFLEQPFAVTLAAQNFVDMFEIDPCTFEVIPSGTSPENCDTNFELQFIKDNILNTIRERKAVDGAAKTQQLLNVGANALYMHDGNFATLAQVVRGYNRGLNRRGEDQADGPLDPADDTSGTGEQGMSDPVQSQDDGSNLDPDITELGLDAGQQQDLVNFLLALTDNRLLCDEYPFDHPSLTVSNGHDDATGADIPLTIPALGVAGFPGEGLPCYKNSGDHFDQGGIFDANGTP